MHAQLMRGTCGDGVEHAQLMRGTCGDGVEHEQLMRGTCGDGVEHAQLMRGTCGDGVEHEQLMRGTCGDGVEHAQLMRGTQRTRVRALCIIGRPHTRVLCACVGFLGRKKYGTNESRALLQVGGMERSAYLLHDIAAARRRPSFGHAYATGKGRAQRQGAPCSIICPTTRTLTPPHRDSRGKDAPRVYVQLDWLGQSARERRRRSEAGTAHEAAARLGVTRPFDFVWQCEGPLHTAPGD
ncbi:unnamed protein product [Lampetra fluviatilis]